MPMEEAKQHGAGREDNPYCIYCTNAGGNLKPRKEVREAMINFYMQSQGKAREEAEKYVDEQMSGMPAWKTQP